MQLGDGVEKDTDEKNLLLLPGIEPGLVGSSAGTILTELCRLSTLETMTTSILYGRKKMWKRFRISERALLFGKFPGFARLSW